MNNSYTNHTQFHYNNISLHCCSRELDNKYINDSIDASMQTGKTTPIRLQLSERLESLGIMGKLRNPSDHHSTIVLMGALNWISIMPRDLSF